MADITVTVEKIGVEDIEMYDGDATFSRTTSSGGSATITKLAANGIPLVIDGDDGATSIQDWYDTLTGYDVYDDLATISVTAAQINDITTKIKGTTGGAVLRVISVKFERDASGDYFITITSIYNGDTLTQTSLTSSDSYYDLNCTGNCLGVLGCFATAAGSGAGGNPLTNANLWGAAASNNLRLSCCAVNNSSYNTFAEIFSANNQSITVTFTYLTSA